MKITRSRFLRAVAILIAAFPLVFPMVCALFFGWTDEQLVGILTSPAHVLALILGVITAVGIFELRSWATILFGLYIAVVAGESLSLAQELGEDPNQIYFPLVALAFFMGALFFSVRKIRRRERFAVQIPVHWQSEAGASLGPARVIDISENGCRIKFAPEVARGDDLQKCQLTLSFDRETVHLEGQVVGLSQEEARIQFEPLSKPQKEELFRLVRASLDQ